MYGDAWDTIAKIMEKNISVTKERFYRRLRSSRMAGLASTIVRYVVEVNKPDADRLPDFHDSELEDLKFRLFSPAPIYKDLEEALLAGNLQMSLEELGTDDEFIKIVLKRRTPEEVVKELINGTKLDDPNFRKSLVEGGEKTVKECKDPLIVLRQSSIP